MNDEADFCIFCRIIDGSAQSSEIYKDETCIAFLDLNPINPGHALVCPLRHVTSFVDLKPEESQAILAAAQRIARLQRKNLANCQGVNLLLSDGVVAGQEVPHTHFHVVPRTEGDGFGFRRFGRASTRNELEKFAALLRQ